LVQLGVAQPRILDDEAFSKVSGRGFILRESRIRVRPCDSWFVLIQLITDYMYPFEFKSGKH